MTVLIEKYTHNQANVKSRIVENESGEKNMFMEGIFVQGNQAPRRFVTLYKNTVQTTIHESAYIQPCIMVKNHGIYQIISANQGGYTLSGGKIRQFAFFTLFVVGFCSTKTLHES